ncbi:hypothetical protein GHK46_29770 [Sinorhizobium medicae]|uniref:hypothetical protein n=1 Tax=Sinorhizobium medicae TaxID=110321 RepID=UPI00129785BE|nr:hypothetical protein [Sinorhizobium medicae]MQW01353.1 hypothetical protein [Sinorhizobium medicae]
MVEIWYLPMGRLFKHLMRCVQFSVAHLVDDGGVVIGTVNQLTARLENARLRLLLRQEGADRIIGLASLPKEIGAGYRQNKDPLMPASRSTASRAGRAGLYCGRRRYARRSAIGAIRRHGNQRTRFATADNHTMKNNLRLAPISSLPSGRLAVRTLESIRLTLASAGFLPLQTRKARLLAMDVSFQVIGISAKHAYFPVAALSENVLVI